MNIYALADAVTEQEREAIQTINIAYTITDQNTHWNMAFYIEDHLYDVNFLHLGDDVKNVSCQYCEANDCLHIKAAYIEVVKDLQKFDFYDVEEDLRHYSYDDLVHMLSNIYYENEQLVKSYIQPEHYSRKEAYAIIDKSLHEVSGLIDEDNEVEALTGINQVSKNAQWLFKKEPYLALSHVVVCIERLYTVAAHCDEDVVHFNLVSLDMQLSAFLESVKDERVAQAVTTDILNTIHTCAASPLQPVAMDCLFYTVIHLSTISKMATEIRAVIEQYKDTLMEPARYEDYVFDLHFNTATKEGRMLYYYEENLSLNKISKLLTQAVSYHDVEEGLHLCAQLEPYCTNSKIRAMKGHYIKALRQLMHN